MCCPRGAAFTFVKVRHHSFLAELRLPDGEVYASEGIGPLRQIPALCRAYAKAKGIEGGGAKGEELKP